MAGSPGGSIARLLVVRDVSARFAGASAELDVSGSGDIGAVQFIVDEFEKTGSGNLTLTAGDYVDIGGPPGIRLIE